MGGAGDNIETGRRRPKEPLTKNLFIRTYGCQMNEYDSARMADVLAPLGYTPADTVDEADLAILNTCHIREKAAEKVFSELGRLRQIKQDRAASGMPMVLAVAGCVAQAEGAEILRRAPYVDVVLGPQTYHRLPEMIARAVRGAGGVLETDFTVEEKFDALPAARGPADPSAFLTIQEGCDKFCTFCVVPYTRGAEYSRPVADVLAEARDLVDRGAREITVLGQNVNAYRGADEAQQVSLAGLLRRLAGLAGLTRLRYTTSHPRDMSDDLVAAHAELPELAPFVHLPAQSGSDRILAAMNRRHKADDYRRAADRLRAARSDIALSSDFIVGFPGEDARDFAATLDLVRGVGYAQAYSFKYSPRPGTPAADLPCQVPEALKAERLDELQALLREQQSAFNRRSVGRTLDVLFDRPGRHAGQVVGRSPYMQAVHVNGGAAFLGEIAPVEISACHANSLAGRLVRAGGPSPHLSDAA